MGPNFFGNKLMLCSRGVIVETQVMACMLSLNFLEKHDVGIQLTQPVAQIVQNHATVEMRKPFVNVVSGYR
jgi:hypothetical protein